MLDFALRSFLSQYLDVFYGTVIAARYYFYNFHDAGSSCHNHYFRHFGDDLVKFIEERSD